MRGSPPSPGATGDITASGSWARSFTLSVGIVASPRIGRRTKGPGEVGRMYYNGGRSAPLLGKGSPAAEDRHPPWRPRSRSATARGQPARPARGADPQMPAGFVPGPAAAPFTQMEHLSPAVAATLPGPAGMM